MKLSGSCFLLRLCGVLVGCLVLFAISGAERSDIKEDERIVFFPTFAVRDESDWVASIHGWIYEPEPDSRVREETLDAFRRLLGLREKDVESQIFQSRARPFLVDNERKKAVTVRLGDQEFPAGTSEPTWHFRHSIRIPTVEAKGLVDGNGWLAFQAVTRANDARRFRGRCQLLEPEGISVISDIDDTIKVTDVRDRTALIANTFLREFEPTPGMAELYRTWAKQGSAFHYVSASPWQLFEPLEAFREKHGYPAGTFHLREFRLKDRSALQLLASPLETKPPLIEKVLDAFPKRKFILVGDSGEKDPEIYGELARKRAGQVQRVLIRDVTNEPADGERYRQAFADLPRDLWTLFKHPREVKP
jgi:phosphatidate phosphatase APP1